MASSVATKDYIVQLYGTDIGLIVRPLVGWMQAQFQRLYPEQDFTFTDDEFVRDQPDEYELRIDWYLPLNYSFDDDYAYMIERVELIRPERIVREVLNSTFIVMSLPGNVRQLLLAYLREQVKLTTAFTQDTIYQLRLRW